MGFSTAGASVIIFAGLLFVTSTTANALFEAQRDLREATTDDRIREDFRRTTEVALIDGGHDQANLFYLNLSNSGATVLDLTRVDVFIDGAWATDRISSRTIEGRITDLWAPGETLRLEITQASAPQRVYFTVETGLGVLWTSGG